MTTTDRGYGWSHQRRRERHRRAVESGAVDCWRCGRRIQPDEPWDLGHDDHDRGIYRGPEHAHCNRSVKPPDRRRKTAPHPGLL